MTSSPSSYHKMYVISDVHRLVYSSDSRNNWTSYFSKYLEHYSWNIGIIILLLSDLPFGS